MASTKKDTAQAQGPQSANGAEFDWAKYIPEGHDASALIEIGGLTPLYLPEEALAQGFPPVYGWVDRIEYLPEQRAGKEDAWTPVALRVQVLTATKAIGGTKDDRKVVDIAVGDDVLVPVTGNLKSNQKLQACVVDLDTIHCMGFRVRGTKDIGRPQDMWDWQTMQSPASKHREGRFAFPQTHAALDSKKQMTAGGVPFNAATGEIADSKIPAQARS